MDGIDLEKKTVGGLYFKKCLPVNSKLYKETKITKEPFLTIYNLCSEKENDIVKSFKVYLDEYVAKKRAGKGFGCSTDIDAILAYLDENF